MLLNQLAKICCVPKAIIVNKNHKQLNKCKLGSDVIADKLSISWYAICELGKAT
jgi:hypothetical protein